MKTPVILIIMDGWGYAPPWGGNAIALAGTTFVDSIWRKCPHTLLAASGRAVGLPGHEMGNSEVGHLNIGSGTLIHQDVIKINDAITSGVFFRNPVLTQAVDRAKTNGTNLHIMGVLSDGGIHGHINHAIALLFLARQRGLKRVYIHAFTDGRDTLPTAAQNYIYRLNKVTARLGIGQVATISGRYFAMDRDQHWTRVDKVYRAMTEGLGRPSASALGAIAEAYQAGQTDEFIEPIIVASGGQPPPPVKDGDSVIFWNFRSDRARQLTLAFLAPDIKAYRRHKILRNLYFVSMIPYGYEHDIGVKPNIAFEPDSIRETLSAVLAKANMSQLHIAETEKYAHVTYFFNGTMEQPNVGEDRIIVPSSQVPTFDLKPEMSADIITRKLMSAISKKPYDFVVVNYANADMVGHSGNIDATKIACHTVDQQVALVVADATKRGYAVMVTADHGNAEQMIDPMTNEPDTSHTNNPVPFIVVPPTAQPGLNSVKLNDEGKLSDIAPTVLALLGLGQPPGMTGHSLLANTRAHANI